MLIKWDVGKLDFTLPCPRATYLTQKRYMEEYLNQLEQRLKKSNSSRGGVYE